MTNDLDRALIALRVSRDHGHGAVLNDAEVPALLAEIDRLRARLEVDPRHSYDGIACRDETIRQQDQRIDRLTRERDELSDEVALKVACINGMSKAADKLAAERDALRSAIRWALGYNEGDPQFGEQPEQKGAFAWRKELRRRAGAALAQIEQERSEQKGGA